MILKTIPQIAKEMVHGLPAICTPTQLGEAAGCHGQSVRRWIRATKAHVMRTQGRHFRIPKDIQERFVAEALRSGRE